MTSNTKAPWPRNGVYRLPDQGGWMVSSASAAGAYRLVEWDSIPGRGTGFRCSCPRGKASGLMAPAATGTDFPEVCSHVTRAARAEQADGIDPRPSPPANVSALVD